jgi:hypothetical protein
VALNTEYQEPLTCFIDQGNAVQKDAAASKIPSHAFYLYRDHQDTPLVFKLLPIVHGYSITSAIEQESGKG